MQVSKKIDKMLFEYIDDKGGFTHVQLVEYFLLFFMIVSIMAVVILEFPVFYDKLWAKIIDSQLFK